MGKKKEDAFKKFLRCADKKKITDPPTYFEKAMIVGKLFKPVRKPTKVILPGVVGKKKK